MGNCQAAEAATVVIQHPGGRVERLYWPTPASDIMRSHPGHYVALITLRLPTDQRRQPEPPQGGGGGTRVRLLRPKDILLLGHVYRLVTSQEVMKGLQARKQEKMRAARMELLKKRRLQQQQQTRSMAAADEQSSADPKNDLQVLTQERGGGGLHKAAQCATRQRQWRPSLQSISEASL
ncbi:hypothetical protein Taro_039191 [Colocasia esculenta]|uniref:Uncharacterized protein n=1 Tax=Colocasia esculenta TaxID=4460 RepID=A0A843WLG5_COLES|nr:hypothetical protein [Colocasia esculenta]